jgi:hypothetical protein
VFSLCFFEFFPFKVQAIVDHHHHHQDTPKTATKVRFADPAENPVENMFNDDKELDLEKDEVGVNLISLFLLDFFF